ncbi:YdcH family protein [Pseudoalteromonas phenolica]|uniref:YdcH family protein n=1 Tax=Pseudoalteromonas phenolica TaxID=161398 RepID=UPI00110B43AE|nr:YdcH family protein [Pseudoalteromonas phenolica]TMO54231.1 GTP-binding protein [Pseudoalteromonas phenolica]
MIIDRHSLAKELPEFKEKIHELKMNDRHFARLFDDYHNLDHEVIRIEEGVENTSDDYLESLKKQRLHLKDQLYAILRSAS